MGYKYTPWHSSCDSTTRSGVFTAKAVLYGGHVTMGSLCVVSGECDPSNANITQNKREGGDD